MRPSTQTLFAPRSAAAFPTVPLAVAIAAACLLALAAGMRSCAKHGSRCSTRGQAGAQQAGDRARSPASGRPRTSRSHAKRFADGVTEVISAEDIGKMPDKNVADALQKRARHQHRHRHRRQRRL